MKALCRALAICAVFLVASGGGATPAPWRQTSFLIGGWGVNNAPNDPARLVRLQEAGLDYLQNFDHQIDLALGRRLVAQLDSLRRARRGFRIQVILHAAYPRDDPGRFTANIEASKHWPEIQRKLAGVQMPNDPSVLGWFLWDEPCTRAEMDQLGILSRQLRANSATSEQIPFVNLLPLAPAGQSTCISQNFEQGRDRRATYAAYLDAYLSQFDGMPNPAPLLSIDHYPFQMDGRETGSYFENLEIARDRAAAYSRPGSRVPLWVTVQLAAFKPEGAPFMKGPTPAQVRWQVWTAVAYGAKSIAYWTTGTTADPHPRTAFRGGLLDLDGRRTSKYESIRQLNRQLHALGPTLMQLDAVATYQVSPGREKGTRDGLIGGPGRGPVAAVTGSESKECLIGHFTRRGGGDDYLLVVNKSLERTSRFRIRLGSAPRAIDRIDRTTGKAVRTPINGATFDVPALGPASAELFRVGRGR